MPKFLHSLFIVLVGLIIISCEQKNCNDPLAINYKPNSVIQDKFCLYENPNNEDRTQLKIKFHLKSSSNVFELDEEFIDSQDKKLTVEILKFYLSNIEINDEEISEIEFVDFENDTSSIFSDSIILDIEPIERVNTLKFGIGVPPDLNSADPNLYAITHPLSFKYDMYWTWSSMYRFFIFEGRYDSNKDGVFEKSFFYHIGLDEMYRNTTIPLNKIIVEGEVNQIDLYFDIDNFQYTPGSEINFNTSKERGTHTENNKSLASRAANAFSKSFETEI